MTNIVAVEIMTPSSIPKWPLFHWKRAIVNDENPVHTKATRVRLKNSISVLVLSESDVMDITQSIANPKRAENALIYIE